MFQDSARGYIASGSFRGNRVHQHVQNQIVRLYCDNNNLRFVLSRAEYAITSDNSCQLWAALNEDYSHIVAYSIMQLPVDIQKTRLVLDYAINRGIVMHFACEKIILRDIRDRNDVENLLSIHQSLTAYNQDSESCYLDFLRTLY